MERKMQASKHVYLYSTIHTLKQFDGLREECVSILRDKSMCNQLILPEVSYSEKGMELPPRPKLFDFHGVYMTNYFTDNWDNVQNFQARPNDIIIATYPKAGTTWVSYILDQLYFGQSAPESLTTLTERVPFLEMNIPLIPSGVETLDKLPTSPRLIKTHLPVQFMPRSFWEQDCRVHYSNGMWVLYSSSVVFGPWYDHVTGWWEKKQTHSKIHYMFYEDMIEDMGRELDGLCSFLGLSPSEEEKERVIEGCHFDNMKNNSMTNYSTDLVMDFNISPFMRKGKVGDWKNHFTVAQSEQFDEDYQKKMNNSQLRFRSTF
ncbi:cytosolic sulfotransferase 2-like isoform X2 [Esox lucius]|uniref:cytosolic sulfotransferase 2-like isoform X2 n=1 Tax=Esox lucius TaxID=8010 RepID=UPI0014773874|nr:cytosolic sulfotransferase 2-like isoform X2 [Esox lucius]